MTKRCLIFAPHFPPAYKGGGPIRTLAALIESAPAGVSVDVLTRDRDLGDRHPLDVSAQNVWLGLPSGRLMYVSMDRPLMFLRALRATRVDGAPSVVYVNGLFDLATCVMPVILARLGFWGPGVVLLAPRGQLDAGALALKSRKKRAFLALFRATRSHRGIMWHASNGLEADAIRDVMGPASHVVVREDETSLSRCAAPVARRDSSSPLRVVFVSRISPIKGLHILLLAAQRVSSGFILDIYGPEEDRRYAQECRRLTAELPAHISCHFHGPVAPDKVVNVLAQYDLFAFPTAGENFGHVIPEALSVGCPVMLPNTTSWNNTLADGGGVLVDGRTPSAWASAIQEYVDLGSKEWGLRRDRSAGAYDRWTSALTQPHVLELVLGDANSERLPTTRIMAPWRWLFSRKE